jgi:hypothetical protein
VPKIKDVRVGAKKESASVVSICKHSRSNVTKFFFSFMQLTSTIATLFPSKNNLLHSRKQGLVVNGQSMFKQPGPSSGVVLVAGGSGKVGKTGSGVNPDYKLLSIVVHRVK